MATPRHITDMNAGLFVNDVISVRNSSVINMVYELRRRGLDPLKDNDLDAVQSNVELYLQQIKAERRDRERVTQRPGLVFASTTTGQPVVMLETIPGSLMLYPARRVGFGKYALDGTKPICDTVYRPGSKLGYGVEKLGVLADSADPSTDF